MKTVGDRLLTVVVPVYNRATVVERTLDSIAAQQECPLDIIIVDNNSTDHTRDVIERWADARRSALLNIIVVEETKRGATAARNRGLAMASTPYVMFFDSDDFMEPTLCRQVVEAFGRAEKPDLVGWDVATELSNGCVKTRRFRADNHVAFNAIVHGMLSTLRYAARRELFLNAGGWNEAVGVWDDMELSVRLLMLNPVIAKLVSDRPLVMTTYSAVSITANHEVAGRCAPKEYALQCCADTLSSQGRVAELKWVDYRRAILAAEYADAGAVADARQLMSVINSRPRFVYRLLYWKHRVYRRGTYLLAPFKR